MTRDGASVLVVENNGEVREGLVSCLESLGLAVTGVGSAGETYQSLGRKVFISAVVNVALPDQSGFTLVEYLRKNTGMRVIILTGSEEVEDRVQGYRSGADLYLINPPDCRELAAAICSIAGRSSELPGCHQHCSRSEKWLLNRATWRLVSPGGVSIKLTMLELNLLEQLASNAGIVKREQLLMTLYGRYDEHSSRALDSLVRRLRAKIAGAGISDPDPIKTARCIGYSFAAPFDIQ